VNAVPPPVAPLLGATDDVSVGGYVVVCASAAVALIITAAQVNARICVTRFMVTGGPFLSYIEWSSVSRRMSIVGRIVGRRSGSDKDLGTVSSVFRLRNRLRFRFRRPPVDTWRVRFRRSTLDLLAAEFAAAVADGDLDAAEGWLVMADRVAARGPVSDERDRRDAWLRATSLLPRTP
jgi:hypothetical protein